MANHIWGYWDCPYCGNKGIRGDNKHCPGCGNPVPPDTKFYIRSDIKESVTESQKNTAANWICEYCAAQNNAADTVCANCGAPKSEAERDYFGRNPNTPSASVTPPPQNASPPVRTAAVSSADSKRKKIIIAAVILFVVGFLIWLFTPVTRSSEVQGFEWERSIAIEEFQKVNESDWKLPGGAHLQYTKQEISGYVQVLDHYEQRSRRVSHEELDGYDVHYRDLGNGQFEEVETPRYRTVWETEYYDEPIYVNQPVFDTKYYYDIDRWVNVGSADSKGLDHEPYWQETGLERTVAHPEYGDRREGERTEKYFAVISDRKGNRRTVEYSYSEWTELSVGDKISYDTMRFSDKPI